MEEEVAQKAIRLSQDDANNKGIDNRTAHVGFYLFDKGLKQLEDFTNVHFSVFNTLRKISRRVPLQLYIGSIIMLTAIFTTLLITKTNATRLQD